MAIASDAAATDPACVKSPLHAHMASLADPGRATADGNDDVFVYRRIRAAPQTAGPAPVKPDPALTA
jgi:pyrroloquinoline quinone biosynthesis protein E